MFLHFKPTIYTSSPSSCFCHFPPCRPIKPPAQTNVGTAVTALSKPKLQAIVPHPALSLTKPAHIGPTNVPPAHAMLNKPYACAYAPLFPNKPGLRLSFASTTYAISAISGENTRASAAPASASSAQRSTFCWMELCVTKRRHMKMGQTRRKPDVASQRGP